MFTTPNIRNQANSNFNMHTSLRESFTPNNPLIEPPGFPNQKQTLHNNLDDKILAERVTDYRIQISSADRDTQTSPNLFNMKASFGNNAVLPNIKRKFKNIKYVSLNSVMTPRTIAIDTSNMTGLIPDTGYNIYPTASPLYTPAPEPPSTMFYNLEYRPFLILRSKELETQNDIGTNPLIDKDTFILIPDQRLKDMILWKPRRTTIVYPTSLLNTLSLLSLVLMDERGQSLSIYNHTGDEIITGTMVTIDSIPYTYNDYIDAYKTVNDTVSYTDAVTQVIYDFTFGIQENELNTLVSY